MNPRLNPDGTLPTAAHVTFPPGIGLLAHWSVLRVKGQAADVATAAGEGNDDGPGVTPGPFTGSAHGVGSG
jgi:hypothetical protein